MCNPERHGAGCCGREDRGPNGWPFARGRGRRRTRWLSELALLAAVVLLASELAAQEDAPVAVGSTVRITRPQARVMSGSREVATVSQGETFTVRGTNNDWYLIEVTVDGRSVTGWLEASSAEPAPAAQPALRRSPVAMAVRPEWLLIAAPGGTDVRSGKEVLGHLLPGRLLLVKESKPPWYKVTAEIDDRRIEGWITAQQATLLTESEAGVGQAGTIPQSIVPARVEVEWKNREVTVRARIPLVKASGQLTWSPTGTPDDSEATPEITIDGDQITWRGSVEELLAACSPGTRSLWVHEVPAVSPTEERAQGDEPAQGEQVPVVSEKSATADELKAVNETSEPSEPHTADGLWHRVDLPSLSLDTAVKAYRYDSFREGLLLTINVAGLLPEYVVEFADEQAVGRQGKFSPLPRSAGALPRVVDERTAAEGGTDLRIAIPFSTARVARRYHLRVRGADGSYSNQILVSRTGDKVQPQAEALAAAHPLPVDATVEVPPVELLSSAEAQQLAADRGLVPVLIDDLTLRRRTEVDAEALVQRQGRPAYQRALAGSTLLLTVPSADRAAEMARQLRRTLDEDPPTALQLAAVDTNDDFGMLNLVEGGLLSEGPTNKASDAGDEPASNEGAGVVRPDANTAESTPTSPQTILDDSSLDTPLIEGGGLLDEDLSESVIGGLLEDSPTDELGGLVDSVSGTPDANTDSILGLDDDPGIMLDPDRDELADLEAAILKLVIEALLGQPSSQNLPGAIGEVIATAIRVTEQDLVAELADPAAAPTGGPITSIFTIVNDRLGLALTAAQQQQAQTDWQSYARLRGHPRVLDRTRNGRVADDVVIWYLGWLLEHQHFHPASFVIVRPGGLDGEPLAVFPQQPLSPDWIKQQPPPLVTPGNPIAPSDENLIDIEELLVPPSTPPGSDEPPAPITPPEKPPLPVGKAVVTQESTPDEVRVPEVEGQLVDAADKALREMGLRIRNATELFLSDRVMAASPPAPDWVAAGTTIKLETHRKVPDVTRLPLEIAERELDRWKLGHAAEPPHAPEDVVIRQQPAADTYVPLDQRVDLTVSVLVPGVVGKLQGEAAELLTNRDLRATAITKAFRQDKVVAQSPAAGALAEHGDPVQLTLHVPVPDVMGLPLSRARRSLEQWDLRVEVPNRLAHEEDVVRGQDPQAGSYVPHASLARLAPVLGRVPDVRGRSVAEARRILEQREDYPTDLVGPLLDQDRVTAQTPSPNTEYERGRAVELDARVVLPNVVRRNVLEARTLLQRAEGAFQVEIEGDLARSDIVFDQEPAGDTLVYPRTRVFLVPGAVVPNLRGATRDDADLELRRNGLFGRIADVRVEETTDQRLVDQVLVTRQIPGPGLYPRRNVDVVELYLTRYELAQRTVPDVTELAVSQAVGRLNAAGFRVTIFDGERRMTPVEYNIRQIALRLEQGNHYQEPVVSRQDPRGGELVPAGTEVSITYFLSR